MIDPDDRTAFATIMDVTWQSFHRNPVDKQTKLYWFNKLLHLPLGDVSTAFDQWILSGGDKLPTIADIIKQCKPKQDFYKALPAPRADEVSQAGLEKIHKLVEENIKPKTDHKKWARDVLANPLSSDTAIQRAKEAIRAV